MAVKANGPLTIGLDIGIASVGWAVLEPTRIVDMGVRCFDAAEDKEGKPHNQTRRGARVARNRYHQRTWRLKRLIRLFRNVGLLSNNEIKQLFSASPKKGGPSLVSPWQLRAEGLARPLNPQEWAQVIYHIVKHRGFKFFSKTENPQLSDTEGDASSSNKSSEQKEREGLGEGLKYTGSLLQRYPQFKTVGHAAFYLATAPQDRDGIYRDSDGNQLEAKDCEEFQNAYRNKGQSYRHAFRRDDLIAELHILFDAQQSVGNPYAKLPLTEGTERLSEVVISSETRLVAPTFRDQVFAYLELQHPPITSNQMDALIGYCELESEARNGGGKAELRAAKHSFSNERATWLQTINNLRVRRNGKPDDQLSVNEHALLINLPYTQTKVTFKQVREKLREAFGFPAHWREASFTKVSYRSNRKNDGSWINVVAADGARTTLGKYGREDVRKTVNKKLKERLEVGTMTFAELRQLFGLKDAETFEHVRKDDEFVLPSLEAAYLIPFKSLDNKEVFIKRLPAKSKKSLVFKAKEMKVLTALRIENPNATLADLRSALERSDRLEAGWQFEINSKASNLIRLEDEVTTPVPIEYEDAQKAEEDTLIELKSWHKLKGALETAHADFWTSLQVAWRDAASDDAELKAKADTAARQVDEIVEVLTKAQTDIDRASGLIKQGLTESQVKTLESIQFKQYRNLSLKALRNILPGLEAGKSYADACKDAGYTLLTTKRSKHLPPLETYLYERIHHGKKTGYKELRYKDLTNPVVARAFNQARLVLNALIDRYDKSPAYVHVELARDIARPLKGHWNAQGKYIEGRLDVQKKQLENSNKRKAARENFIEIYGINEPNAAQILKERLYHEQDCKCIYTLEKLDLDSIIRDENYAQIDHIWPRSLTFDNSMENRVLVHARANQDKDNRIPYDFIMQKYGAEHWRMVEKWVLSCKGMSDNKQKRLLAKELDADEFNARNLVDTRYATRLIARAIRDRLLFDGQVEDKTEDINPSESGKTRLEKFHNTRVRTPQGGLVAFLRRSWLGDIKDREASDRHHALDACVVAACTPSIINEVNGYFSNEEKIPNRFKKNSDGTYTDKCNGSGETISKQEARERGLYLPPPWDSFRDEFRKKYNSVFVSRAIRKKRSGELHDANPLAFRKLTIALTDLTPEMLTTNSIPAGFREKHRELLAGLANQLARHNDDAQTAFAEPYKFTDRKGNPQSIHNIALPVASLPAAYLKQRLKQTKKSNVTPENDLMAHKVVRLTELTLKKLEPDNLGASYYHRNQKIVDALRDRLKKFKGNAKNAFKEPFHVPLNSERNKEREKPLDKGPIIRSIRLPESCGQGVDVRGGIAKLGASLRTDVYWTDKNYCFQNCYEINDEQIRGTSRGVVDGKLLFPLAKNDYVRITLKDGAVKEGYFVFYTNDGEMQVRRHDLPKIIDFVEREAEDPTESEEESEIETAPTTGKKKKKIVLAQRITNSENRIANIQKFKVGLLGDLTPIVDSVPHGLA